MISPGTYNIDAFQGATFNFVATWSINGTAVDLTNYSSDLQVRTSYSAANAIFSLSENNGITLGGTAGTITVEISAAAMGSAVPGLYLYDLELDSGSEVTRLLQGTFEIKPEVTR